jgi:hypothetical protein
MKARPRPLMLPQPDCSTVNNVKDAEKCLLHSQNEYTMAAHSSTEKKKHRLQGKAKKSCNLH